MIGYTVTKRKYFDIPKFLVMFAMILLFSCLFVPFVAIYSYQDIFVNRVDAWFFGTPNYNYFIFAATLASFSVLIFIYLYYRNQRLMNDKKVRLTPFYLFALPGLFAIVLSFYHYHYLNDDGIHVNPYFQLKVDHYKWEEVNDVIQQQSVKNGVMYEGSLVFTFNNGKTFYLPVDSEVRLNKKLIYQKLRKQGIEVKRVVVE
jgi:hypothetical protein